MTRRLSWTASLTVSLLACRQGGRVDASPVAGACPSAWLDAPVVDPQIAVPSGDDRVVLHAFAKGIQKYACTSIGIDGGTSYGWSFVGPEATLDDCHSEAIGRHFASDAGAPEWRTGDGAYVVAHKTAAAAARDGAVPWLLLSVDRGVGGAPFTRSRYVQRVRTSGGTAPSLACDASLAGTLQGVPYTADYFFYAPR
jgi:hypothetical protein